jgi:Papain family cysteine protease
MKSHLLFLVGLTSLALVAAVRAEELQKLRYRGGEVYASDADLRAAFDKANPQKLPEAKRKLPAVTAATFDWTTLARRPLSYTQRKTPYCWAFAAMTAFEWNWAIRNGGPAPTLAVQPVIDRTQKEGAASWEDGLQSLLEMGTCNLNIYPYTGKPGPVNPNIEYGYRAIAWGFVSVQKNAIPAPEQMKQALLDNGPLVSGVFNTPAFETYKGGIFREHFQAPEAGGGVNHAVVIVGWDDRKGKGCWKVQNSWGPAWGEGGYMWIEYGCNNVGKGACWVRSQSVQYLLPPDIHQMVNSETAKFRRWPKAAEIALPARAEPKTVTVDEALKKQGETVVVEFQVKGLGLVQPEGHVEFFSTTSPQDERCLAARVLKPEFEKFPAQDREGLFKYYKGKRIRVRGSLQPFAYQAGTRLMIEVADPAQIEIVK